MTLFQHTLRVLLTGQKTETSRLALPEPNGETCKGTEMIQYPSGIRSVMRGADMRWFPKWQVGRDYAIQPARGVKSVGRYRIENIWKQDVRTITPEQLTAEGFINGLSGDRFYAFMRVWTLMHDPIGRSRLSLKPTDEWRDYLDQRDDSLYTAWRMQISVLWDTVDWDAVHILMPSWKTWRGRELASESE